MSSQGWWGFDLDGTLAHYDQWGDGSIGVPIHPMVRRIRHYLKQGRIVKIVTARVHPNHGADADVNTVRIRAFLLEQFGDAGSLIPIVWGKDMHMITLFDDRATQVIPNTGITVQEELRRAVHGLEHIAQRHIVQRYGMANAEGAHALAVLQSLNPWSIALARKE